jgi:hypothetical protein
MTPTEPAAHDLAGDDEFPPLPPLSDWLRDQDLLVLAAFAKAARQADTSLLGLVLDQE